VPFVLALGITGHRSEALAADALPRLRQRLRETRQLVAAQTTAIHRDNGEVFSATPPRLLFVSPLADGADQTAAEIALELGFELQAILPFPREQYLADLPSDEARARAAALLAKTACLLELPGDPAHSLDAYVMAGRATVAHSDFLLAVWDGLPARGRGGTAEVVDLAVSGGTPLLHIPIAAEEPPRLHWSAFDPAVITRRAERATERPFTPEQLGRLLTALLLPPPDPGERNFVRLFQSERSRKWRARLEYPLLLTLAGIDRVGRKHWQAQRCSIYTRAEWQAYRASCCAPHGVKPRLELLEEWYDWCDRLASHFAQSYRSGQVFNFVSAAAAALIALSTLILPQFKGWLAVAEFALVVAILINTRFGVRQEWHRRWLDYRQLAERIRPMRSLKLLGIASPDPPGSATAPVAHRWIDWYSAAVWRATGCPAGRIDRGMIAPISTAISQHELRPQIDYHRASAAQIQRLDHRLERIATLVFTCSLIGCVVLLVGLYLDKHWVEDNSNWFTLASAGLPAVGAAIFGIRFEGDFGGSAVRSQSTAIKLEEIATELEGVGSDLMRSADLVEQAARAMLADLDEWRLINQQHDLSVG
jgi:hypothetical protein